MVLPGFLAGLWGQRDLSHTLVSKIAHAPWNRQSSRLEVVAELKPHRGLCTVQVAYSLLVGQGKDALVREAGIES